MASDGLEETFRDNVTKMKLRLIEQKLKNGRPPLVAPPALDGVSVEAKLNKLIKTRGHLLEKLRDYKTRAGDDEPPRPWMDYPGKMGDDKLDFSRPVSSNSLPELKKPVNKQAAMVDLLPDPYRDMASMNKMYDPMDFKFHRRDILEYLMLQNAQIHQSMMQTLMLKALQKDDPAPARQPDYAPPWAYIPPSNPPHHPMLVPSVPMQRPHYLPPLMNAQHSFDRTPTYTGQQYTVPAPEQSYWTERPLEADPLQGGA